MSSYLKDAEASHYMQSRLKDAFEEINGRRYKNATQIPVDKIIYTQSDQDVDRYVFTCFIEAVGGNGFGRLFFT